MTVEIKSAQTEVMEKKKKKIRTFEPEREQKRTISLWDEHDDQTDARKKLPLRVTSRLD